MSPRPHDGTAEEGLSSSLLQVVNDPERLDRLRWLLSGFCHRCRNSLNGIKLSLYLFRREARGPVPDCWGDLETIYREVEYLFDHLQTIYRPMPVTMVRSPLGEFLGHHEPRWRSWYEARCGALEFVPPDPDVVGEFDPAQLGVGLDAVATWRAGSAEPGALTRIGWAAREGWIEVRWQESGSRGGGEPPWRAGASTPPRAAGSRRVDDLALPLLARIVAAHGGRLRYDNQAGFSMCLRWPQFPPANPGQG
jgi:hypothetical protein